MEAQLNRGVRVPSGVTNMAAAATGVAVFQVSNFAQQIGTKSFKVKKLIVENIAGGTGWFSLGLGLAGAFVANMPAFWIVNNMTNVFEEADIPDVEYFADLCASVAVLAAGGSVNVQVEVEEIG